ncbi:MAG: YtxH domain-containing protein [Flavobacterium sp.]|jgi:gas vesicle protein|uniref:YtxH domain-containing protein n=1 Tax=Flavobacterium algoritolerans TaxID=3041254 RepID=A0ABT6V7C4_9FLAO|nr:MULTISPECIES: YtxH domain-containing protein [Flavobacterium]MDI5888994.1 YtxH domain-containing protein [Flavobacterium yafengii]MDI5894134.1 YtxH domain-containing protein [Flavobacterium algoritolerans]MDI6048353.1 YtxH domain-containing protein [Flavobacterium sp. XS2P24]MDP3681988.1 YtxH domain-containing protein [Flavobacterium sp.]PIF61300.1 gas vesicle protein [Flavobacterium sp. 11]
MSNNTGNTLLALLTGAAIGAGIGILFAPDKGSKTRGKIKDGFDDVKCELKNKLDNASLELKDKFTSAKFDLEETYEELVSNMSHKTEDVISFLEEKLAELKRQNAKLQK